MADIFISYSKVDRDLTERLAKELEAKGYTVWWDTALVAGQSFRDAIKDELEQARAVIVVWTRGSIKSDWVVSEAERARALRKLVQLRSKDVAPTEIPQPFDVLHTELVTNEAAITAALAKLGLAPQSPEQKPATAAARLPSWIAAVAVAVALAVIGTAAYIHFRPPARPTPPVVSTPPPEPAIVWTELPAGSYLVNWTKDPVAAYVLPDRSSGKRVDIAPGEVIPTPASGGRLERASVKSEPWLRFHIGTDNLAAYVPEKDVTLSAR